MAHRHGNPLHRFVADAGYLAQLFFGHVRQVLYRGDAGRNQLLQNLIAQLGDLFDRSLRSTLKRTHRLFDLLPLLLLGLDVDLPSQQLGRQAYVLALLADRKRQLRVIDDDLQLLVIQVRDRNTRHLGRLQRLFGKRRDLFGVLDDVDLFATELADDRLYAHALHAHARTNWVHIFIARNDGDLGAFACLTRDRADRYRAVVDFRNLALEEVLHQAGRRARDNDLRPLGGAVDPQ